VLGIRSSPRDAGLAEADPFGPDSEGWSGSAAQLLRAARLRHDLALDRARGGELVEASRTLEGAVRIYRRLALAGGSRHRAELAEAISCWGAWSSRLGRREHARGALSDAVELYREELTRVPPARRATRMRLRGGSGGGAGQPRAGPVRPRRA